MFTLAEYTASGSISPEVANIIEDAVLRRLNIVVVGGTSSGKTTFVNAVIDAIYRLTPSHRLLILEDTAELQSKSPNAVFFRTSVLANVDMRTLAKVSMRYAPKRILVGEVRDSGTPGILAASAPFMRTALKKLCHAWKNWWKKPGSVPSKSSSGGL